MALTALNLLSARKETAQPRPKVYQLRDGGSLFCAFSPTAPSSGGTATGWAALNRCTQSGCNSKGHAGGSPCGTGPGKGVGQEGPRPHRGEKGGDRPPGRHIRTHVRDRCSGVIVSNAHWSEYYTNQVTSYLEKDVFPGLASCRSAASGLHICAPSSKGCGGSWREDCGDPHPPVVGKSSVMRLPKVSANTILPPCSRDWSKRPQVRHNLR